MDDFDVRDTILYPMSYSDIVLIAQNLNPEHGISLREEFQRLLNEKVEEALELFDEHEDDIYAEAFPDAEELVNHAAWPEERCERLAMQIYRWLIDHDMWIDTCIYYNGKRLSTDGMIDGKHVFRYNGEPFVEEGIDPRDYFDYVANPHILSMSFEGPLFTALNYGGDMIDKFEDMFRENGCYFELGDAWNLTCYPV